MHNLLVSRSRRTPVLIRNKFCYTTWFRLGRELKALLPNEKKICNGCPYRNRTQSTSRTPDNTTKSLTTVSGLWNSKEPVHTNQVTWSSNDLEERDASRDFKSRSSQLLCWVESNGASCACFALASPDPGWALISVVGDVEGMPKEETLR